MLTEKQKKLFNYILSYTKDNMRQPSRREMAAYMGVASTNAIYSMLESMEKKGYIKRNNKYPRGLTILKKSIK